MWKRSAAPLFLTAVLFLVGALVVMQLRAKGLEATLARSAADQAQLIGNLIDSNQQLRQELDSLRSQIAIYQSDSEQQQLEAMVADLNRMKMINGLTEVVGEGVEVAVGGGIRATDLNDVLNELRNAGAEAIAINRNRVVASSVVSDYGNILGLGGIPLTSPYILEAIGGKDTLERALERKGGLLELLRYSYPSLEISVTKKDQLLIPVYQGSYAFSYAQPAS